MAAQDGAKLTPARASRATTQTIAELEERANAIREANRDAMHQIAVLLRDLAVTLPAESKLPLQFAETAKKIDLFNDGPNAHLGFWSVESIVRETGKDVERAALEDVLTAVDRVPASSRFARSMEAFGGALRNAIDEL